MSEARSAPSSGHPAPRPAEAEGWVFGIDGGGTCSRIRVESLSGRLLMEGAGRGMNPKSNPSGQVDAVLAGLLDEVLGAGFDARLCRAGFLGCAGVDRSEDKADMAARLGYVFRSAARLGQASQGVGAAFPALAAGNDTEPALAGALADVEGFLLIAGTGSIACGRSRSGRCVRSGGWGHILGDEGSAFWIALEGIRRGIRSSEGREKPSGLLAAALSFFGLSQAFDLLPLAYEAFDKARIASFAPRVTDLAAVGDVPAGEILAEAARELSALVCAVYRMLETEAVHKRLAFHGGLIDKNPALRSAVAGRLAAKLPDLEIVETAGDPAQGACRLARSLLG